MTSGRVYLMEMNGEVNGHYMPVKIGKSNKPDRRLREQTGCPAEISLLHDILTNDMDWLEKLLHHHFANKRIRKNGEWFSIDEEDKEEIQQISVLDRVPLGLLYGLKVSSIDEAYFFDEPGQADFALITKAMLRHMLTAYDWKLEEHGLYELPHSSGFIELPRGSTPVSMGDLYQSNDCPSLVVARRKANLVCTAALRHSDALRKAVARARLSGLLE